MYPVFLGFVVADGALEMAYDCIQSIRLPLVLDLDETVVKAYTVSKLTKEIDELTAKMAQHDAGCAMSTSHVCGVLELACTIGRGQSRLERSATYRWYACCSCALAEIASNCSVTSSS